LEGLLQNLSNAKLDIADLRKIGDKNYIKLFKVAQLNLEYLAYQQSQAEYALACSLQEKKVRLERCNKLETKVKDR
jgi:hypothetical protein